MGEIYRIGYGWACAFVFLCQNLIPALPSDYGLDVLEMFVK
jgi:hypothetical protein